MTATPNEAVKLVGMELVEVSLAGGEGSQERGKSSLKKRLEAVEGVR